MTTAYTSLLGLALPVTGELSGTWGDTVNTAITSLLDTAIAGTTSITTDSDITLTTTTGASNQARQAIILWNPASGTVTRNITAPAQSKIYTVINASGGTQSIVIRGVGPTTGVTVVKGESALVAWNGSDFVKVSSNAVFGAITVSNLTDTALTSGRVTYATTGGLLTDSANLTFNGTTLTAAGLAGPFNGTVGATTPSTGAFTTLTTSSTVTLNGGTANGVLYLNGSKVATSGTSLIFDGTNLAIGNATANQKLDVWNGSISISSGSAGGTGEVYRFTIGTTSQMIMNLGGATGFQYSTVGTTSYGQMSVRNNYAAAYPAYSFLTDGGTGIGNAAGTASTLTFHTAAAEVGRFTSAGRFLVGTSVGYGQVTANNQFQVYNPSADGVTNTVIGSITSQVRSYGTNIATSSFASIKFCTDPTTYYYGDIRFFTNNADSTDTGGTERGRFTSAGSFLVGTSSASGAKMDLAFSTTQNGLVVAPTTYVYPTYSLISTNGVIGTVKSGSGSVNLIDIRASEATSLANGRVTGAYFQIDNANAAVNANGGQIGVYGLVNGVSNYTVGHQYGVYGRAGSGGTYGIGVMAVLGSDQSLGYRAALVALTNNTTDRIASFHNSGGEYVQINGLGSLGIQSVPNRWFSNRSVIQMASSVSAISAQNGYEFGLNFYVAETTAADKRVQSGYANKMYSDAAVGDVLWATAGTGAADSSISWGEKMRLTNAGQFLIGSSSALIGTPLLDVRGSQSTNGLANINNNTNSGDVNHGMLNLVNSATGATGNDARLMFTFRQVGFSTGLDPMASFGAVKEAADFAAGFTWNTRSASAVYSEKMRLTSGGAVCIGTTSTFSNAGLVVDIGSGGTNRPIAVHGTGGVDGTYVDWLVSAPYGSNTNEINIIKSSISINAGNSGLQFWISDGGGASTTTRSFQINRTSCTVVGSLSKGSGSFKIDHPLPEKTSTHHLVHSFIEGPQADLIYRGKVNLVNGLAIINIDQAAGMTEGTFVVLCRDVQCFTTNESDWTAVRGAVSGNILTIETQDNSSTASISWMVIGERQDKHMYETEWTDENGKVIVEPLKPNNP